MDLLSEEYRICESCILNKYKKGKTWEQIKNFNTDNENDLNEAFNNFKNVNDLDQLTLDDWYEIFEHVKSDKESEVNIVLIEPTMIPSATGYDYKLNNHPGSAWSSYKEKLLKKGFTRETINSIEDSAHKALNKLSLDTTSGQAVKGLIVGNVQSGKTSNMAALMAMGADLGFNLFVVLSGSIENLRIQTQDRLIGDLNGATNVSWITINNVSTKSSYEYALSKLDLNSNSRQRYLMVCLKNSTRLCNLLTWLNKDDKNRKLIKLLIIDDEADQAGVNAKPRNIRSKTNPEDIERTKINKAIVNLLNNRDQEDNVINAKLKAINYVAYTATPYANILNEKPGMNSIYPSNFVASLGVSNEYFGPQQIFGLESENLDGMNIINEVTNEDLNELKKISNKSSVELPSTLKDAIMWFYCGLATMRIKKFAKPFSMLIHTSQNQEHHQIIADLIKKWMKTIDVMSFVKECEVVYNKQISQFTMKNFWNSYPKYGNGNTTIKVDDYLDFKLIANEIAALFTNGLTSILIDDKDEPKYSKGVHLCIDNCAHNYLENNDEHIRLLYPPQKLDYATGFIVIGGATLSRGLTIEGLLSTYFVRTVKQADSLMQMGRWFGYRKGYELYPRIWMSEDTKEKFKFLSVMDYELRLKMKEMEEYNISPEKCGIKILNYANKKLLITAKNKSKAAEIIDKNFDGITMQNTMFFSDETIIKHNYDLTVNFVNNLVGTPTNIDSRLLWKNIDSTIVINYMKQLKFPNNDSKAMDVKLFDKWFDKLQKEGKLGNWNVAISGSSEYSETLFGKYYIHLTNRSKKSKDKDGIIRIGALRSPQDLYVDIDKNDPNLSLIDKNSINARSTTAFQYIRTKVGLNHTPLLVIYVIDHASKAQNSNRFNMDTATDLIGLMVLIPENNESKSYSDYIGIDLSADEDEYEVK